MHINDSCVNLQATIEHYCNVGSHRLSKASDLYLDSI